MKLIFILTITIWSVSGWSQSSMRRCTLLPVTDSVGGAIGFKVFEEIELRLKQSNWCTYVSNSGLIGVFSKYRDNLAQHLKSKEVLSAVAEKLRVGSLIRIGVVSEVRGVEIQLDVYGENGQDLYFSEKKVLVKDDLELITNTAYGWLEMYAKTIPYDAKLNGILGEQVTMDVGKGYPIQVGQKFIIKRPKSNKKHPLLKKIVDWETEVLAEGTIVSVSDNQAMGMLKFYKSEKKITAGDWVRLEDRPQGVIEDPNLDLKDPEKLGTLGILSMAAFVSSSSTDTHTATGNNRMAGNLFGVDLRGEGWITRNYFAAIEIVRSIGTFHKRSGTPAENTINVTNSSYSFVGGYKYLPIGFFYGPQVDLYGGYAKHIYDLDVSNEDGFGQNSISGFVLGSAVNIPMNNLYRFFGRVEFIPFPNFNDEDNIYGSAKSVSSIDLELGVKYQYKTRITFDGSLDIASRKAKFKSDPKEVTYNDNRLKLGASFNF